MNSLRNTFLAIALIAGCGTAMAAATPDPAQANIPFVNMHDSIHGWQADGEKGLWIQDAHKNWFYARIMAPCPGLEFAPRLGFETKSLNSLDRYSYVLVPDSARCQITSLTKSDAPKDEKKSRKPESSPK